MCRIVRSNRIRHCIAAAPLPRRGLGKIWGRRRCGSYARPRPATDDVVPALVEREFFAARGASEAQELVQPGIAIEQQEHGSSLDAGKGGGAHRANLNVQQCAAGIPPRSALFQALAL